VVSTEWINEVRYFNEKYSRYLAADQALQVYLPQDQQSRITFGMGRAGSNTGIGMGYAYVNEDGVALTAGIGTSGGETVGRISVGFEFGGDRKMKIAMAEVVTVTPTPTPTTSPEPVTVEAVERVVLEQQQQVQEYHEEDIQQVQMAQSALNSRVSSLEERLNRPRPKPKPVEEKPLFTQEQKALVLAALGDDDE
jgi:2',3'-cyclic-nucleotide 2'-phosphodiesterase (5'-nucleotidase family)